MNKKGALVLRDVLFMMLIVSSIFVFSGLFVSEIAFNYGNTNMSDEWALTGTNTLANSTFYNAAEDINETADDITVGSTGIVSLIANQLEGVGNAVWLIVTAPNTIGSLVAGTLEDLGVGPSIAGIIRYLIVGVLWGIVIFTIASAFLRGGRI